MGRRSLRTFVKAVPLPLVTVLGVALIGNFVLGSDFGDFLLVFLNLSYIFLKKWKIEITANTWRFQLISKLTFQVWNEG